MKRMAFFLSVFVLAGALRPALRHDCGQGMSSCAPRAAVSSCHRTGASSCHKEAAPARTECPGMACCLVQEDRAAVAAVSVAPVFSEEGLVAAPLPFPPVSHDSVRFCSSPSPPGDVSSQIGFLASSSLRGPPALA